MPDYMNGIWYLSLMTIGVGFIVWPRRCGIHSSSAVLPAYWFISHRCLSFTGNLSGRPAGRCESDGPVDAGQSLGPLPLTGRVGIGMLIGGAVNGVSFSRFRSIKSAVRSACRKPAQGRSPAASRDEMPIKTALFR